MENKLTEAMNKAQASHQYEFNLHITIQKSYTIESSVNVSTVYHGHRYLLI